MTSGRADQARLYSVAAATMLVLMVSGAFVAVATNFAGQWDEMPFLVTTLAFGLLGALVLWRRPGNTIAWVFSGMGLSGMVAAAAPEAGLGSLIGGLGWFSFLFLTLAILPMLYPTGKPISPRWRWVLVAALTAYACFAFLWVFQETVCNETQTREGEEVCIDWISNPIGIEGIENPEQSGPGSFLLFSFILSGLSGLVSLVIRYRRAQSVERQQLKWLLFSFAALMSFVFFVDILFEEWFELRLPDPVYAGVTAVVWLGLPTTTGLAIFRFGLYDIDRVISRTLAYGLVVATLTVAYLAVVLGVGALAGAVSPSDAGPAVPILATALVAIAFQPVRLRAMRVANRLVFGKRRTPYEALAGIGGGDLDELAPQIARLAAESTTARRAIVWLSNGVELQPAAVFPDDQSPLEPIPLEDGRLPPSSDVGETLPLMHQESLLGAITVVMGPGEELPGDDRRLLIDLASHAAVTLHGALEATPLPTGIVTFLMTDIVGSTRLWEDDPEAMTVALREHDGLARRIIGEGGGILVKWRGEGDSSFSVFTNAAQAVTAAMTLQGAIAAQTWRTVRPISIRAALHTGEAELRERDYFGQTVNRCARLRSLAGGGQTLVSAATRELAREGVPDSLAFNDLGEQQLKDMSEPERVYEVVPVNRAQVLVE